MNSLNFGAIDIGSNAARLLIATIDERESEFNPRKASFIRVPLRLGEDVFSTGTVSEERQDRLVSVMHACKHLLHAHTVRAYRACATAALREARNKRAILARIRRETGINLEIIDGAEEARIICEHHAATHLPARHTCLYVDVGGGSTEISLIHNRKLCASRSFNIGALRLLSGNVPPGEWECLDSFLADIAQKHPLQELLASGGNINKLYRMVKPDAQGRMSLAKLRKLHARLQRTSLEERITRLGMRPDRADVIVPAAGLFLHIAQVARATTLNVPAISLTDGIIAALLHAHRARPR